VCQMEWRVGIDETACNRFQARHVELRIVK
jgi:hypothetical protein